MAKKKKTLRELIAKKPDAASRTGEWYERLEQFKPDFYAELCEVVTAWNNHDPAIRRKYPKQYQFGVFISEELAKRGITLKPHTTESLIRFLNGGTNG